jgi:hypothetical protein
MNKKKQNSNTVLASKVKGETDKPKKSSVSDLDLHGSSQISLLDRDLGRIQSANRDRIQLLAN